MFSVQMLILILLVGLLGFSTNTISSSENHNGSPFSLLVLMPFFSSFFFLYKLAKNVSRIIIGPDFLLTQTFISSFPETVTFVYSSTKVGFTPSMLILNVTAALCMFLP